MASELSTDEWVRVFQEAGKMGALHAHLTGGEPLARTDLTELIRGARTGGLYTNLITSGIGLNESRLRTLVDAGLEHIQLSFQDSKEAGADEIAGTRSHAYKLQLARTIKNFKIAFTVNVVVHRQNLDRLGEIIDLAEELGPDRLEIANVQYYGWALQNRTALLPTRAQLEKSQSIIAEARKRLSGRTRIDAVVPDYYAQYPKACMGGWGRSLMLIDPAGQALPCHAAGVIPGLQFENVSQRSLQDIWEHSAAFQKFRGEDWMQEPCRSCERRKEDFGGCRCQALLLAGDAAATDPVCSLAPARHLVDQEVARANPPGHSPSKAPDLTQIEWIYRPHPA